MRRFAVLHAQNYFYNRLVYSEGLLDAGKYGEKLQYVVSRETIERNKVGGLLDLAYERMDEMKFIGIVEEFDKSMFLFGRILSRHFQIPEHIQIHLVYCRSNNSYKNLYEPELGRGLLADLFKVDNSIFDYAKKKFYKHLSVYGDSFEEDYRIFKARQDSFEKECCNSRKKQACEANYYTFGAL